MFKCDVHNRINQARKFTITDKSHIKNKHHQIFYKQDLHSILVKCISHSNILTLKKAVKAIHYIVQWEKFRLLQPETVRSLQFVRLNKNIRSTAGLTENKNE